MSLVSLLVILRATEEQKPIFINESHQYKNFHYKDEILGRVPIFIVHLEYSVFRRERNRIRSILAISKPIKLKQKEKSLEICRVYSMIYLRKFNEFGRKC